MPLLTNRIAIWPTSRRLAAELVVAIALVVVATLLRVSLNPILGHSVPFIIYFVMISAVAWLCSPLPTLFAIGLSAALSVYYFIVPTHSFALPDLADRVQVGLYLFGTLVIASIAQAAKLSKQRATEAEQFSRLIVESSNDCIKVLDLDGRLLSMNEGGKRVMDVCNFEAIRGSTWTDFWKGTEPDAANAALSAAQAGGTGRFQGLCKTMAGVPKWWDVAVTPMRDSTGHVNGILSISRDITEQKDFQARLAAQAVEAAAQRERLELALSASKMGYWTWNMRTNAITWSDNLEDIHGLPKGGFDGTFEGFNTLIHPEHRETVSAAIKRAIETDGQYDIEFRCLRPDGKDHWMRGLGRVFNGADGQPERMVGIGINITAEKAANLALQRSERYFRLKIELSPFPTAVADRNGHVFLANPAHKDLFGTSLDDVAHLDIREYHEGQSREIVDAIRRAYAGEPASVAEREITMWIGPRRGEKLYVRSFAFPLTREDGEVEEVVVTHDDVSDLRRSQEDLKKSEQALRTYADDLKRSNDELEQFAFVAAHDLQEPIRMIISYLQLIERQVGKSLDAKTKSYMELVTNSATRMRLMVSSILEYSRIGKEGDQLGVVSSEAALQAAEELLDDKITASGAVIEKGSLPLVQGIESQITRLFQNLISNAIKFRSENPPRIFVSAEQEGDVLTFSVSDNGIGIKPEEGRKLFGLFQRLHANDKYPGTGIGLATCKKVVEQHHGRIWFEPGMAGGTTFKFTLPAGRSL